MAQVINVLKCKNMGAIAQMAKHNLRLGNIKDNVDVSKTKDNVYFVGSSNMDVLKAVDDRLEGLKYRKDANKVVNLVFSASHDEFKNMNSDQVGAWAEDAVNYCKQKFGEKNILYAVLHKDELTPHLHISFTPIVDNKLRSNIWFDGPKKLQEFRKEVYNKVSKQYGFKEFKAADPNTNSLATADEIKEFYNDLHNLEKVSKSLDADIAKVQKLPKFSLNVQKLFKELLPSIQNIVSFSKATYRKNKKLDAENKKALERIKSLNAQVEKANNSLNKFDGLEFLKNLNYADLVAVKEYSKELEKNRQLDNEKRLRIQSQKNNQQFAESYKKNVTADESDKEKQTIKRNVPAPKFTPKPKIS